MAIFWSSSSESLLITGAPFTCLTTGFQKRSFPIGMLPPSMVPTPKVQIEMFCGTDNAVFFISVLLPTTSPSDIKKIVPASSPLLVSRDRSEPTISLPPVRFAWGMLSRFCKSVSVS